jgi:flagellar biosynthesis protein FlhB
MPEESLQEKTEQATPKKRQKAREEGQVAKSVELSSVAVLLTGMVLMRFISPIFGKQIIEMMRVAFTFVAVPQFNVEYCLSLLNRMAIRYLSLLLPVMGFVFVTALGMNFLQVGLHFSSKAIAPKFKNLSVLKGMKRFVSVKTFGELVKSVIKLVIIGWVAYYIIKDESPHFVHLYDQETAQILVFMLRVIFKIFLWVILAMAVLAVLDYAFQKWQFEEQLKMTKQDVKDENKQTEGDPQVKSRIRGIQMQAARQRMMQQVPEADVVVTNPTHLALAIRYSPEGMGAPEVVAKGAGLVAQRIKEVAAANGVPVVENKKLAQNLYKIVNIGEEIPIQHYQAVAELLAYVYKLKGKTAG